MLALGRRRGRAVAGQLRRSSCVDVRHRAGRARLGALLGELDRVFDLGFDLLLELRRSRLPSARRSAAGACLKRSIGSLLRASARPLPCRGSWRVADVVAVEAVGVAPIRPGPSPRAGALDGRWPLAMTANSPCRRPSRRGCRSRRRARPRSPPAIAPVRRGPTSRTGCSRRRRRPAASRARPGSRLVEDALLERAVAEEADATAPVCLQLGGQRRAGRETHAAADDAVGAEHVLVDVGDVHAAALAACSSRWPCRAARPSSASGRRPWRWCGRGRGGCW